MKFEYNIKDTFRAVELLLYIPHLKESPHLEKSIMSLGSEYYFISKKIGSNFLYYHINTSESSGSFGRIIKLGMELRYFLLKKFNLRDFMIYSFSRVLHTDSSLKINEYQKRIMYLYDRDILHSLFFVDNYIERAMHDDFDFKKISNLEYLLKGRVTGSSKEDKLGKVFIGRNKEINDIKEIYNEICKSLEDSEWIDLNSTFPNLIGIKAAPGVGKSSFVRAFLGEIAYNYPENFYIISKLKRNNAGPFHPYLVMLNDFLNFPNEAKDGNIDKLIEKYSKKYSKYLEETDKKNFVSALKFIYELLGYKISEDDKNIIEEFDLAIQNLFSALIKKTFEDSGKPYIFVFEDIHLYSQKSKLILEFILKNFCIIKPALFILTYSFNYNAKYLTKFKLNEIVLDVFNRNITEEIADIYLDEKISKDVLEDLYVKSCGHPFYISRYLIRYKNGQYIGNEECGESVFPENIQAVISGKLHYLPEYFYFVLQLASILGDEFTLNDLQRLFDGILEEPFDLNLAIAQLVDYDIIGYNDENIYFLTKFYRIALYETILEQNKKYYHSVYSELLEEDFKKNIVFDPMLVAENYFRSDKPQLGIRYLVYKIEEMHEENRLEESKDLINYGLKVIEGLSKDEDKKPSRILLYLSYSGVLSKSNKKKKEKKLLDTVKGTYLPKVKNLLVEYYFKLRTAIYFFTMKEYKQCYNIANEVMPKFEKEKDRIHLVDSLLLLGQSAYFIKDAKTALSFYNVIPQHNPTLYQQASFEYLRGNIYFNNSYLTKAIKYLDKSFEIMKKIHLKTGFYNSGKLLGNSYFALGDYDNAYNIFLEIMNEALKTDDHINHIYSLLYCGKILFLKGNLAKAEELLNNANDLAQKFYEKDLYINSSMELADYNITTGDLYEAVSNLNTAFDKLKQTASGHMLAKAYILRSLLYFKQSKYDKSLDNANKALEHASKVDLSEEKEVLLYRIYTIYYNLKSNEINVDKEPDEIFEKAHDIVMDKLSNIDSSKQKQIYREKHYYVSKIITRQKDLS